MDTAAPVIVTARATLGTCAAWCHYVLSAPEYCAPEYRRTYEVTRMEYRDGRATVASVALRDYRGVARALRAPDHAAYVLAALASALAALG